MDYDHGFYYCIVGCCKLASKQEISDFELADILCHGVSYAEFIKEYGKCQDDIQGYSFDFFKPEPDVYGPLKKRGRAL